MRNKKGIAVLIIIFMLASTAMGFAATVFSDVASTHWANEYITKMSEKGIIKGFEDSNTLKFYFKPDNSVTYIESIQMIYQTLKAAEKLKSTTGLVAKHQTTLTSNNIPVWAHEAVAYALEYSIVHKDELKIFINKNVQANAKRADVAVYLGKALNMEDAIDPLPILNFVDSELIVKSAVPYIELLVRKGIISGDNNNRFNPNNAIRRAEMATMCSKALDLIDTKVTVPGTTTPSTPQQSGTSQNTDIKTIEYIIEETNTVVVKNSAGEREVYGLEKNAYVKIDGKMSRLSSLSIGQKITLVFDTSKNVIGIEKLDILTDFAGRVEKIVDYTDYYLITVKDYYNPLKKQDFKVYSNAQIILNNRKVAFDKLKVGDVVDIEVEGDKAKLIEIEAENAVHDGILDTNVYFNPYPTIKVKIRNNEIIELELDEEVEIKRNSRTNTIESLIKGDIVTVTVRRGKVTSIIATSVDTKRRDEGSIKAITLGSPTTMTIVTEDKEDITYDVARTVLVEIDKKDATLYDLRPNFYVKLSLTNGIVTSITADKERLVNTIVGEIQRVYSNYNMIAVNYMNAETGKYETKSITITDDTKIISTTGTTLRLAHLQSKDQVFIDGYEVDNLYIASRIIMLN